MDLEDICELSDDDLFALAVQVRVWMICAKGRPLSLRRQLVRLLSRISTAFEYRGWSTRYSHWGNFPNGSRWARVHDEARRRVAKEPVRDVARELAAWLERKPVAA